jgi:hypothetical protein
MPDNEQTQDQEITIEKSASAGGEKTILQGLR